MAPPCCLVARRRRGHLGEMNQGRGSLDGWSGLGGDVPVHVIESATFVR
jgi:hypothetical protein